MILASLLLCSMPWGSTDCPSPGNPQTAPCVLEPRGVLVWEVDNWDTVDYCLLCADGVCMQDSFMPITSIYPDGTEKTVLPNCAPPLRYFDWASTLEIFCCNAAMECGEPVYVPVMWPEFEFINLGQN